MTRCQLAVAAVLIVLLPETAATAGAVVFKEGRCREFPLPQNLLAFLQNELKAQKFYKGRADGSFNDQTLKAIRTFRTEKRLPPLEEFYVDLAFMKELLGPKFETIADRESLLRDCVKQKS